MHCFPLYSTLVFLKFLHGTLTFFRSLSTLALHVFPSTFLAAIYIEERNPFKFILAILIVLLTVLAKPTGIALLGAILAVAFYKVTSKLKIAAYKWMLLSSICILFLLLTNKMLSTFTLIENDYAKGEIVYGITTVSPNRPGLDKLIVIPPNNMYIPPIDHPPLLRIISFIIHHPAYWLKLFITKLFYFFFHIRPYWSLSHNLFSLLFLIPVYFFSIRGLVVGKLTKEKLLFLVPFFALHVLSVGLSTVDWDGRFLMPLLPVLFLLATAGIPNTIIGSCQKLLPFLAKD